MEAAQGNTPQPPTDTPQAPIQTQPKSQSTVPQPTTTQRVQVGRPHAGKLSPADRVPIAIVALMQHNLNSHPNDRWFLSGNIIATAAGANPALVVRTWLQNHPSAVTQLEQHNTAIGLNARSNGKEKNRGQLKAIYQQFVEGKAIEELQAIASRYDAERSDKSIVQQFESQTEAVI